MAHERSRRGRTARVLTKGWGHCGWPDSPQGLTATNGPVCQTLMGNNGCRSITTAGWARWGLGWRYWGHIFWWILASLESYCTERKHLQAKYESSERWHWPNEVIWKVMRNKADCVSRNLLAMTKWLFPNYYPSTVVKPHGQGQMGRRIFHFMGL